MRDDLIVLVSASDPTYRANGSKYFTHDEEIFSLGLIFSGPVVLGTDPKAVRLFTN